MLSIFGQSGADRARRCPIVDELAEEYDGVVDVRKCDVEENVEVAAKFGIMAIPTIVFVKDGKEIARKSGTVKKDQLVALIEANK